jgi:hypothetical protein
VTSAYDVSTQKWNVVSSGTGLKVLSNIAGTPSLKVGENNICQLNLSRTTENCDIELVPYVDNNIKYSDNVFRIKVKDEDLYLATDENTNTEVCWTTFAKSMLWKFISPFDIIPEIKDNTLRLFLETFKTVIGFDNDIITEVIELHKKTFNIDTVYLNFATIKASCDVALNYESDEGYGANITIDPDEVESGTIGYENYLFGLETTLEDFNDITNIGDLIQKIKDVGVLLKGGNFAFKSSISDARKGKFDILCNIDLMPDHPKTHLEMAITFHIDIDFDNNSSIKFNPQCAEVSDEFILMFISILLLVLIITGRGAIILKFLSKLVALFPLRSGFILG